MSPTDLSRKLFAWWCNPESVPRDFFAEEFEFDGGIPGSADFMWWVKQKPPWTEVELLDVFATESRAVVLFEGVDSATRLHHRVAWIVHVADNTITKVIETVSTVGGDQP